MLNPVQVSVNLDDLSNNKIINDKKTEVQKIKKQIEKLSVTYLQHKDIFQGLDIKYKYNDLIIKKEGIFDSLDQSQLIRDYLKLFSNILR